MNLSTVLSPSPAVRAAQRETAHLLHRACQALELPPQPDGRYETERLALSDICEALLAKALTVILESPTLRATPLRGQGRYLSLHLNAALLGWLAGKSLDAGQAQAIELAWAQLSPTNSTN